MAGRPLAARLLFVFGLVLMVYGVIISLADFRASAVCLAVAWAVLMAAYVVKPPSR